MEILEEVKLKLGLVQKTLAQQGLQGARFRGVDWFAWITGGASSVVILTAEVGVAEVLVTPREAFLLTNVIEAARLQDEELRAPLFECLAFPWQSAPEDIEAFVKEKCGAAVVSDRPQAQEKNLPQELLRAKRRLFESEIERYRALGRDAAEAMTEVLHKATPSWTEEALAGAGAEALWRRGIEPTLTLSAGARRAVGYRHPTPGPAKLEDRAMLVFCGRRHGLYANLTRWVYFRRVRPQERQQLESLAEIEAQAFAACRAGTSLGQLYQRLAQAYAERGHPGEVNRHHQGGTTGYLSREVLARPEESLPLEAPQALALNPSLPGGKIEDTVLVRENSALEILTVDPRWPVFEWKGLPRPDLLERDRG